MSSELEDFIRRMMFDRPGRADDDDDNDPIIEAEIVEEDEVEGSESSTSDESRSVFNPREREPSAGNLDDRSATQAHGSFGHRIGQLSRLAETDPVSRHRAAIDQNFIRQLRSALSSPNSLRQAIVLSEVLTRPEHRW